MKELPGWVWALLALAASLGLAWLLAWALSYAILKSLRI